MQFPFEYVVINSAHWWLLLVLWYLSAAGYGVAVLWRKMQPPPPVPRPARPYIHHKVKGAAA